MGEVKHTPGPWAWTMKGGDYAALGPHDDDILYPVSEQSSYGLSSREHIEVGEADAILIAAAPDLLEALERLRPILDRAESNASGNQEWEFVSERIDAARAAIAKATGEA